MFNDDPLLRVRGAVELKTFAAPGLIAPVLAMITPPVATNGVIHSMAVAVLEVPVLY